ncbi:hypothetical protein CBR_g48710 [Chara braunii]|uniref:Non-lysosomal glucosylceramidase n=1 Tax=Chara braunii TaxID=69332 RepID=A0A388K4J8_CHABU|nr:hypothetical protein CBR_g48710 [Chara braunii]|eukprot:GBG64961.1 hypothetical protein CBR_g48710 [Chara braunii]
MEISKFHHLFACAVSADLQQWELYIEQWQQPILQDTTLPEWYRITLFNELYYLVAGGSIWIDGPVLPEESECEESEEPWLTGKEVDDAGYQGMTMRNLTSQSRSPSSSSPTSRCEETSKRSLGGKTASRLSDSGQSLLPNGMPIYDHVNCVGGENGVARGSVARNSNSELASDRAGNDPCMGEANRIVADRNVSRCLELSEMETEKKRGERTQDDKTEAEEESIGRFLYLEGIEYLMWNTVDTRGGTTTKPYTQEQEEEMARILVERRAKQEKKELLKQAKLKAIAEEQEAKKKKIEEEMMRLQKEKMPRLQEEEEEKRKAVEEEAATEEEVEEEPSREGAGKKEGIRVAPREKTPGWRRRSAKRQTTEDEKKSEWKLRMMREKKRRREETNRVAREVEKVRACRQEVQTQAEVTAKLDKIMGYLEVLSEAWLEEHQANKGQDVTLHAIRSGIREFVHDVVTHVRTEVRKLKEGANKFCTGAIGGAKVVPTAETAARSRKEPVKLKFPDAYSGKKDDNFDNWEASVNTYVYLQHIAPEEQVLVAFHALKDEAASFARSLARAADCEHNMIAYLRLTPLSTFLRLLRERFADVTRGVRVSDKLQTIHSRQWKSARALKAVMDDLVAVPDHGVTETQLVQLFYRAMPEPLRGHFFDKTQQPNITYDELSREVVLYEAKSMPVTTFWHKDLDKGKKWKGRTISGQVRAKDHRILTLDEGGTDEVPYSQIEWGLEEEDSSLSQGGSFAAVVAGGRPQGPKGPGHGRRRIGRTGGWRSREPPSGRLFKKEAIWQWDEDCTSALKKLKRALIKYPVLKVPDSSLPFVVTTDASRYGIGAVLQQDEGNGYRPVEFMSARMPSEKVATSTYDVHFYASFALIYLFPKLELSLQRDMARAILEEVSDEVMFLAGGELGMRKVAGCVPHDMGISNPWIRLNAYNIHDTSRWKDLNSKFVLQVYRDYVVTGDMGPAQGPSAYCGGLWIAALQAAAALSEAVGDKEMSERYASIFLKGREAYVEKLWNGRYFNYDSSQGNGKTCIQADQMAGQWYTWACGLRPLFEGNKAQRALETVFNNNVMNFCNGRIGAVNGMYPNGKVDSGSMQSREVWTGVTYGVAAAMIYEGLAKEAFITAEGIFRAGWCEYGYWFQTPEAWTLDGRFRSLTYMRPLAIWAMQFALNPPERTARAIANLRNGFAAAIAD